MTDLDERVAQAGSFSAGNGNPLQFWYRPHETGEQRWTMQFYTVRTTRAGNPRRKSWVVKGASTSACMLQAAEIVDSLAADIAAGRDAHRKQQQRSRLL